MNVDYQEKMDPTHRMYLCRMLSVKELPEDLLERYAQVKRLVDRIDGHLTPGDLAMIIVCPFVIKQEDMESTETDITKGEDARLQAGADERAVKTSDDGTVREVETITTQDVGDDKEIEKILEPPVSGTTGQATIDRRGAGDGGDVSERKEAPSPTATLWSPGMPVNVLHKEEIMRGRIVGVSRPSEVGEQVGAAIKLTVEFEGGETETFDEKEVEAD